MSRPKTIEEMQAGLKMMAQEAKQAEREVHVQNGASGHYVTYDSRKPQKCEKCGRTIYVAFTKNKAMMTICQDQRGNWTAHFPLCDQQEQTTIEGNIEKKKKDQEIMARIKKAEEVLADEKYKNHEKFGEWSERYMELVDEWQELTGQQYNHKEISE